MENHDLARVERHLASVLERCRCPMCGGRRFARVPGVVNQMLSDSPESGAVIVGPSLTCLAVVCRTCGFVSLHSVHALEEEGDE